VMRVCVLLCPLLPEPRPNGYSESIFSPVSISPLSGPYSDNPFTTVEESWPDLLLALFLASKQPDPGHRESAFRIFATTPGIIEKQHSEAIQGVFVGGFGDDDLGVRIAAMEAFSAFFRSIKKAAQKAFYPLLTHILNILVPMKDSQDSDNLSRALMALIDLAEVAPLMFKPLFNNVVKFGISVVQDKDLTDSARQNALELLATFADNAPNMCKKDPLYTSEMVTQCLSLMTDIGNDDDDASEWNESDDVGVLRWISFCALRWLTW